MLWKISLRRGGGISGGVLCFFGFWFGRWSGLLFELAGRVTFASG